MELHLKAEKLDNNTDPWCARNSRTPPDEHVTLPISDTNETIERYFGDTATPENDKYTGTTLDKCNKDG